MLKTELKEFIQNVLNYYKSEEEKNSGVCFFHNTGYYDYNDKYIFVVSQYSYEEDSILIKLGVSNNYMKTDFDIDWDFPKQEDGDTYDEISTVTEEDIDVLAEGYVKVLEEYFNTFRNNV